MDSSPSSSSSSCFLSKRSLDNEPVNEKYRSMTNKRLISNCLIALPLFSPPPIFLHNSLLSPALFKSSPSSPSSNLHFLLTTTASQIIHNLGSSIASTADRCFHVFSSHHNTFLNKLFSLSDDFHNLCRLRNYYYRNRKPVLNNPNFAAILPGDSVAGIVVTNGILNFLNVYNTLLVVRLVLTWFPNSPPAIVSPLSTLCDPYLNIFRGIIPPLGGTLDLSPILAFLLLNALTSTASALPAELIPSTGEVSSTHKKWMTRFAANTPKTSKTQT